MNSRRCLLAMSLVALAVELAGAQSAQADPLTPPTPNEIQYLAQARHVLTISHDPQAFRSCWCWVGSPVTSAP
jgi:hypothetical protein